MCTPQVRINLRTKRCSSSIRITSRLRRVLAISASPASGTLLAKPNGTLKYLLATTCCLYYDAVEVEMLAESCDKFFRRCAQFRCYT
jgi:hypothetical protein